MQTWKPKLTPDILREKCPYFPTLKERIAAWQDFYGIPEDRACVPSPIFFENQKEDALLADRHTTEDAFSTVLFFYNASGTEYSFSKYGMRCIQRQLPWRSHYHTHDFIEIFYVVKGRFEQILLGKRRTFFAGEFVITDRNLEHADYCAGVEDSIVLFLWLKADYLDRLLDRAGQNDLLHRFFYHALQRQRKEQSYIHLSPGDVPMPSGVSVVLERLMEEDSHPQEGSREIIRGNLLRLLSILQRSYSMQLHSSDPESREQILLYEVERYIHNHLSSVCANDLEQAFHYHRNYYSLLLKKYTGLSFQEYVQKTRLEYAAQLLVSSALPIRDILQKCGYANSSHFYHLFWRQYSMSPAQYREVNRKTD